MQKFALVSRSRFALVALLASFACVSFAGCEDAESVQNTERIYQENRPSTDVKTPERRAENPSETEAEKKLADRRAAEDAQNAKIYQECDDLLNQTAVKLYQCMLEQNPEKYLAGVVDLYAEHLANLRSLDASGCSLEFQNAFADFVAHFEKMANLIQELQTLQQQPASELDVSAPNRMIQIGEEFERLSNQVTNEANKLKAAM